MFFFLVCTQSVYGSVCRCQQPYVWPSIICLAYGACDSIIGDTCSCINGLPPIGQLCQLNFPPGRFHSWLTNSQKTAHSQQSLYTELNNLTLNPNHACLFLNVFFALNISTGSLVYFH